MWIVPIIEIIIIAVLIHYLLSFFWNTRAMDLIFGFLALLLIFFLATWLKLPVLEKIMIYPADLISTPVGQKSPEWVKTIKPELVKNPRFKQIN